MPDPSGEDARAWRKPTAAGGTEMSLWDLAGMLVLLDYIRDFRQDSGAPILSPAAFIARQRQMMERLANDDD